MNKKYILILLVLLGLAVIVGIYFATSNKKPEPKITPTCTGNSDNCKKDCKCLTTDDCNSDGTCTSKIPICTGYNDNCKNDCKCLTTHDCNSDGTCTPKNPICTGDYRCNNNSCKCETGKTCNDAGDKCLPSCDKKSIEFGGQGYNCKENCICSDSNSCDHISGQCYCRGDDYKCNDNSCICEKGKICSTRDSKCWIICNNDDGTKTCDKECECEKGSICSDGKCFKKWSPGVGSCDNSDYKCKNNYKCINGFCICSALNNECGDDCICSATAQNFCNDNKCKICEEQGKYHCGVDCLCKSGLCGEDGKCDKICSSEDPDANCTDNCKCDEGYTCNKDTKQCKKTCENDNCPSGTECECRLGTSCQTQKCKQEYITIYGYDGKYVELKNPIEYTTGKGNAEVQKINGCWTLNDFKDDNGNYPLKGGWLNQDCAVTSLTLPDNIKAEGFTAKFTWYDLCGDGGTSLGNIVSKQDVTDKKPCGFRFTKIS